MSRLSKLLERLRVHDDPRLVDPAKAGPDCVVSDNPSSGEPLMAVRLDTAAALEDTVRRCVAVQAEWRMLPAPKRGEIVRRIGEAFRE
ncbi:MAG: aldehyde dehydrogenase family protein, partial [Planctomycetes bacterium]|nr:aldehyde dehydrogenase family protein [Planctomycetota bacterium]